MEEYKFYVKVGSFVVLCDDDFALYLHMLSNTISAMLSVHPHTVLTLGLSRRQIIGGLPFHPESQSGHEGEEGQSNLHPH